MRRLLTPRWLLGHLLAAAAVTAMLGLAWWQIGRARGGNALSVGYSLEWPVFAGFVVFFWIKAMRSTLETASGGTAGGPALTESAPAGATEAGNTARQLAEKRAGARASARARDPETAAYNHYLAWLNAHPHRQPADYPGMPDD